MLFINSKKSTMTLESMISLEMFCYFQLRQQVSQPDPILTIIDQHLVTYYITFFTCMAILFHFHSSRLFCYKNVCDSRLIHILKCPVHISNIIFCIFLTDVCNYILQITFVTVCNVATHFTYDFYFLVGLVNTRNSQNLIFRFQ